jgi:hypothetical protein
MRDIVITAEIIDFVEFPSWPERILREHALGHTIGWLYGNVTEGRLPGIGPRLERALLLPLFEPWPIEKAYELLDMPQPPRPPWVRIGARAKIRAAVEKLTERGTLSPGQPVSDRINLISLQLTADGWTGNHKPGRAAIYRYLKIVHSSVPKSKRDDDAA